MFFDDVHKQVAHYSAGKAPEPDLAITGSPCNPFSTQRSKRFVDGNVSSHISFNITMQGVVNFYKVVLPKVGITEQVEGFDKPMSTTDSTTPLELFLGQRKAFGTLGTPGSGEET